MWCKIGHHYLPEAALGQPSRYRKRFPEENEEQQ